MSKSPDEASVELLLGVLRADVVEPEPPIRRRIGARLARGVLVQLLASVLLATFVRPRLFGSKAFAVAVALPVGIALGASGHAWLASQKAAPAVPVVAAASHVVGNALPPAAPAASTEVMEPVAATPTSVIAPPPSPATAPSRRSVARAPAPWHGAARELSQLEKARTLLSEGRTTATLSLLRSHFARYRHSSFEQERQALFIRALVEDHQLVEARTRAAAFVRRFPKSTLHASVESAVAPIP